MSKTNYSPLLFLASLGNGGLAVSFFMYLMFMTEHPHTPIPTFNSLSNYFIQYEGSILFQGLIILSIIGIVFFSFQHFVSLVTNIRKYQLFKKTEAYQELLQSNTVTSIMAIPLTLAMTVNVCFILGAVFIPGLWTFVEYLFPIALLCFGIIGFFALKIFLDYFSRMLTTASFDFVKNNNLSQMLAMFAFAMISVGFAASASMSTEKISIILGLLGSIFFITITIFFSVIKIILGFKSMLKHGIAIEASPSIWIVIPILTLIGITFVRQNHGLHTSFSGATTSYSVFIFSTVIISLQIVFAVMGYKVMKQNGYFTHYLHGGKKSVASYALICPGVAFFVYSFFFIHLALLRTGIIEKFSILYFILIIPLIFIQYKTIRTLFILNKNNKG